MKHTPGPWIGQTTSAGQGLIYSETNGQNVAVAYDTRDTDAIALAPQMVEALRDAVAWIAVAPDTYRKDVVLNKLVPLLALLEGEK